MLGWPRGNAMVARRPRSRDPGRQRPRPPKKSPAGVGRGGADGASARGGGPVAPWLLFALLLSIVVVNDNIWI
jgi:hypothetical protein